MTVPYQWGKMSSEALAAKGCAKLDFKSYNGLSHGADPRELEDVAEFIRTVLPPQPKM